MTLLLKTVPASRGPRWIADAFRLFARKPLAVHDDVRRVPVRGAAGRAWCRCVGGLVQMAALPLLSLGFMIAGQSALAGGPVHPAQFIEPLRGDPARRRSLLILCAIYGVPALAILLLADAVSDSAWARLQALMAQGRAGAGRDRRAAGRARRGHRPCCWRRCWAPLLSVPFWHAPALVHWGGQGVAQALFSSTLAVWRCKGAFFTYSLAWVGVIAALRRCWRPCSSACSACRSWPTSSACRRG